MAITIILMAISLVNILVLEILLLFNVNELHIYIFNGHQIIKHVNSEVFMPLIDMKRFFAINFSNGN